MSAAAGTNPLRHADDRRLPRIAGPCGLVVFGVTGDLSRRKLLPAIYDLANRGRLPPGFALTGFGRRAWAREEFTRVVHDAVRGGARTPFRESVWLELAEGFRFVSGEFGDPAAYDRLADVVEALDVERGTGGNHAFYLSVPPAAFPTVCGQLARSGLSHSAAGAWRRVVVEKPFGQDLASAQALDDVVSEVFPAGSIFRIDHYLGKETVQNLLALRFANRLFEPLWNAEHVDHVQITMAEDIGIGGRAGYYDGIGAARDVVQNHLLQLLALTAMEPPASFGAAALRAAKEDVLAAVRLPADLAAHTARGQYAGGWQGGARVPGYLDESGVAADSTTETFAAVRLDVDAPRWRDTPFYLRAGKRLGRRVTEIALVFRPATDLALFAPGAATVGDNALVVRIQPDQGVTLRLGAKVPDTAMEVRDVTMDFGYGHAFTQDSPEAYERLILDVLLGDPPLFPDHREVELSWQILDPVLAAWARAGRPEPYRPGTWGPDAAAAMLARDGRVWRMP